MPGSSNFDLTVPPDQPLSLAEYCTALAENRFKGTVRGQPGSSINREDNTLCNFRAALLVDFFQDLNQNTFLNYFADVNTRSDGTNSSAQYTSGAFGDIASSGGAPGSPSSSCAGGGLGNDGC